MLKDLRIYQYGLILLVALCLTTTLFGLDLGSSSGIFNKSKPKKAAPKTPPKKAAPPKAAARKVVPKPKAAVRTARTAKSKPDSKAVKATETPVKTVAATPVKTVVITPATTPTGQQAGDPTKPPIETPTGLQNQTPTENTAAKNAASEPSSETPKQPVPSASPVADTGNNAAIKSGGDSDDVYEKAIETGNTARDERNYPIAEAAYLRAQSLENKDSRAVYGLGNLYSDQQRWEEAERAYRSALEIAPNAPESYVALSYVLTQPVDGADSAVRYAEAEKLARKAVELDPKNAFAYDQLGAALELGGKISDETRNNYQKAIELDPNFALAYAHLGRLLGKNAATKEATAAYEQSIKLAADVPAMIMVADVLQSQQKFIESEQLLRRALKGDAKNPTALYMLGRALTVRSSYDEAEKILKKAADVSPNSFISYTLLGSLALRRNKLNEAEKYLAKAVKVASPNETKRLAGDFEAVGDAYLKANKNKDAARLYQQAIALDKDKIVLADKLANASK